MEEYGHEPTGEVYLVMVVNLSQKPSSCYSNFREG